MPVVDAYYKEHPGMIYMEDNAPPHSAKHTQAMFEQLGIARMPWPASSPDLNPIETIWNHMKAEIRQMEPVPSKAEDMKSAILSAWEGIDQGKIDRVIETMPARIQAVIAANGGHTPF